MKRVYVAGAYSGTNVIEILQNIGRGEWYAAQIFKLGYAPFAPWHDKDFVIKLWDQELNVEMFYKYSLTWLEVSDIMFLVPGWEKSKGTLEEIKIADKLNIKIISDIGELNEVYGIKK